MATREVTVPSLSARVSSAQVVMIFLNGLSEHQIPNGSDLVSERVEKPAPSAGRLIDQERNVSLMKTPCDLMEMGFVPVRSLAFQRQNKKFRAVLTMVHKDHMKDEDSALPAQHLEGFMERLAENVGDATIYRNHGASGANFVIDYGNLRPSFEGEHLFLGVQDDRFGFFDGDDAE